MEPHLMKSDETLERLSALLDGELNDTQTTLACADWRCHTEARTAWHTYHLIGDALRSEDLARDASHDSAFMQTFRARLSQEPVVLAPLPSPSQMPMPAELPEVLQVANGAPHAVAPNVKKKSNHWSWVVPSAFVACFIGAAGTFLLNRPTAVPQSAAFNTAGASSVALRQLASGNMTPADQEPQNLQASIQLIRDVRLDSYLAAHKQFAGSSALGVPSGFLRSAITTSGRTNTAANSSSSTADR
jgi:sigma-E factor negative regulatory protein RseA